MNGFRFVFRNKKFSLGISLLVIVVGLYAFKFLGTEFLPELNEGSIWVRATMPYSISLDKSVQVSDQMRVDHDAVSTGKKSSFPNRSSG